MNTIATEYDALYRRASELLQTGNLSEAVVYAEKAAHLVDEAVRVQRWSDRSIQYVDTPAHRLMCELDDRLAVQGTSTQNTPRHRQENAPSCYSLDILLTPAEQPALSLSKIGVAGIARRAVFALVVIAVWWLLAGLFDMPFLVRLVGCVAPFPLIKFYDACGGIQHLRNCRLLRHSYEGNTGTVIYLLKHHADPNVRNKYGDSPLHLATRRGHIATIEALVSHGAILESAGEWGDTPLHIARYDGATGVAQSLRQLGHQEVARNKYGLTPTEIIQLPLFEREIVILAELLNDAGNWRDESRGRYRYNEMKRSDQRQVINALVRRIVSDSSRRTRLLLVAIKLGFPKSEEKLNDLLKLYGDLPMVEDYLNSGSWQLRQGAESWAMRQGYTISSGHGSHRASWGEF